MYGRCSLPAVLAGILDYMLNLKTAACAPAMDTRLSALCTLTTLLFSILSFIPKAREEGESVSYTNTLVNLSVCVCVLCSY